LAYKLPLTNEERADADRLILNGTQADQIEASEAYEEGVDLSSPRYAQLWRDRLVKFLLAIEIVAAVMVTLIGATTVTVVVFATRAGLAVHNEVIEVLHLIGARDEYVARQFQTNALKLGLKGGIAGSVAGILTLLAIRFTAAKLDIELFPTVLFQIWHWPILGSLPLVAAFIVRFSARLTVLQALRRMP